MKVLSVILLILGILDVIQGLLALITGKVDRIEYGTARYREESLKKFARPLGISNLISGAGMILFAVLEGQIIAIGNVPAAIPFVVLAAALIVSLVIYFNGRKLLDRK